MLYFLQSTITTS